MKTSLILLLFLTGSLIMPLGFYEVQATKTDESGSDGNNTETNQIPTDPTNATSENIGQQISNFVHNATALFKQQRDETIQAIKDCRLKAQNATGGNRTQAMNECHTTLNAIREKYQDMRNQFQELFKQFRDSIITLRHHEEGLQVSPQDRDDAIKKINDDAAKHGMSSLGMALGHLKDMGGNGTMEIEKALKHVNETSEYNQSGMSMLKHDDHGQHGPSGSPGKQ